MTMQRKFFKLCLVGLGAALGLCACITPGKPKGPTASLRFHIQTNPDGSDRSAPIAIYRANPMLLNVEKQPFLDERSITNATVVDSLGSFAIQIQFDASGAKMLEQYSTSFRSRHCAIFSQWGQKTMTNRWLAAPKFTRSIFNGTLVFTPDATREESQAIVAALKNTVIQVQKSGEW
jgi:preprotein translocase subunit SecD